MGNWKKFYLGGTSIGVNAVDGYSVVICLIEDKAVGIAVRVSDGLCLPLSKKFMFTDTNIIWNSGFLVNDISMMASRANLNVFLTNGIISGFRDWIADFGSGWSKMVINTDLVPCQSVRLQTVSRWVKGGNYIDMKPVKNKVVLPVEAIEGLSSRDGLVYKAELKKPVAVGSTELEVVETLVGTEKPPVVMGDMTVMDGWKPDFGVYMDGVLGWSVPKEVGISVQRESVMPFVVKSWAEQNGVLVSGSEVNWPTIWGVKAKVSEEQWPKWKSGVFGRYIGENGRWLTWQPNGMTVGKKQPVYFSFLVNDSAGYSLVRLWVQANYESGAVEHWEVDTVANVSVGSVLTVAVGYEALGLDSYELNNNKVVKYTVWLVNEVMERISRKRTMYVDYSERYDERYVAFVNSLGGWDSMRMIGGAVVTNKIVGEVGRIGLGADYVSTDEEYFVRNKKGDVLLKLRTGGIEGRGALNYLQELAWSERVLYRVENEWVSVSLENYESIESGELEFVGEREFLFRKSKEAVAFSALPESVDADARPTAWVPSGAYCLIDEVSGKQTGYQGAAYLKLYYTDVSPIVRVPGVGVKKNVEGTDGYVAPKLSSICGVGVAAYYNTAIVRSGSKLRNNCEVGSGLAATIVIAAGTYGGTTQAEADARAEAAFLRIDTQEYANANGVCEVNPWGYTMGGIPSGKWNWRWFVDAGVGLSAFYIQSYGVGLGVIGNGWHVQEVANVSPSEIYAVGSNDLKLPCTVPSGFDVWRLGIYHATLGYGTNKDFRLRIYVNGVIVRDVNVGSEELDMFVSGYVIPDGARVYVWVSKN